MISHHTEGIQDHAEQGCKTPNKHKQKLWVKCTPKLTVLFTKSRRPLHNAGRAEPHLHLHSQSARLLQCSSAHRSEEDARLTPTKSHFLTSLLLLISTGFFPLSLLYCVSLLLPKPLRQSSSGQLSVQTPLLGTAHDPNDEAIQPG